MGDGDGDDHADGERQEDVRRDPCRERRAERDAHGLVLGVVGHLEASDGAVHLGDARPVALVGELRHGGFLGRRRGGGHALHGRMDTSQRRNLGSVCTRFEFARGFSSYTSSSSFAALRRCSRRAATSAFDGLMTKRPWLASTRATSPSDAQRKRPCTSTMAGTPEQLEQGAACAGRSTRSVRATATGSCARRDEDVEDA